MNNEERALDILKNLAKRIETIEDLNPYRSSILNVLANVQKLLDTGAKVV